jgi:pilus assembly protein Flp/PilA
MLNHAKDASIVRLRRLLHDESGATAIEYALIASGIAVAIAATVVSLGSTVKGLFVSVQNATN